MCTRICNAAISQQSVYKSVWAQINPLKQMTMGKLENPDALFTYSIITAGPSLPKAPLHGLVH